MFVVEDRFAVSCWRYPYPPLPTFLKGPSDGFAVTVAVVVIRWDLSFL